MSEITKKERSRIMSKIKSKDTKPELLVRSYLHQHGVRFRKHCNDLKGSPDICIRKYKIAIYINGCFWHGHENCKLYSQPKSNTEFWIKKIRKNQARDYATYSFMKFHGWNYIVLWECEIYDQFEKKMDELLKKINNIRKRSLSNY